MKKIDLITGYLGSGKTTFIRKYVKYLLEAGEKICILENDFGAVNVDMMLLSDLRCDNLEVEMVAGGCDVDCHRRRFKTKLIAMGMDDYSRIIIEPSGIFDVDEFFDVLYDEPLNRWYEIGSVIAIVDAGINKMLSDNSKYVFASEIANAGAIILSKTQNYDAEEIEKTKIFIGKCLEDINCDISSMNNIIDVPWDEFDKDIFNRIITSGYKKNSFIKMLTDQSESYNSLYFLDKKITSHRAKDIAGLLFGNKKYGNVIRIKGLSFEENHWNQINITENECLINEADDGQDVLIVIGENLDEALINALLMAN